MKNKNVVNRGFTLVELLIVVLIVGILVSVALPLYHNAVDKSRWAKLLSPARAIANAEEAILMSNGTYTANKEDLVVSLPNDGEYTYTLYTTENGDDGNFVRLESNKLEDVRLARYYRGDENYSEQVYCEAKSDNSRAQKLCGKLLQGDDLFTTDDGYKAYLIEGKVLEGLCRQKLFWSDTKNTCYMTERDRCTAHGMDMTGSGDDAFCGCTGGNNTCKNGEYKEGSKCVAAGQYGCNGSEFYAGSKCETVAHGNYACVATFYSGSECVAGAGYGGCGGHYGRATFKSGSKCIDRSTSGGGCASTYEAGSACVAYRKNACKADGGATSEFQAGSRCIAMVSQGCAQVDFSLGACCQNGSEDPSQNFCPSGAPMCP